jgi:hypothetical protein
MGDRCERSLVELEHGSRDSDARQEWGSEQPCMMFDRLITLPLVVWHRYDRNMHNPIVCFLLDTTSIQSIFDTSSHLIKKVTPDG